VRKLVKELADPEASERVTGRPPEPLSGDSPAAKAA